MLRSTLVYRWHPRVHFGVEYNPKVGEVHPLLTLIPVTETANRPAVIFGISSDRIGTPSGTSVYLTASKDLENWTGLPIAPYGGVVYGTHEDRIRAIGGMSIRLPKNFSSLIQFDGVKVHPTLTYTFNDTHSLTFLMIRGTNPGVSYTFSF
ncbi:MAG TPA: hypothetical protein VNA17_06005 [Pyrinomonadaceae bacterium]|nr:hypothetical protein [Pyrinomonadaceae bacterium]